MIYNFYRIIGSRSIFIINLFGWAERNLTPIYPLAKPTYIELKV